MIIAGKMDRLINCICDAVFIFIIAFVLILILRLFINIHSTGMRIVAFIIIVIYYVAFEYFAGQTPGKMISRTKLITKDNRKPGFIMIVLRTIIRFTGVVPLSFLFGTDLGIHDILTNTRVVKVAE